MFFQTNSREIITKFYTQLYSIVQNMYTNGLWTRSTITTAFSLHSTVKSFSSLLGGPNFWHWGFNKKSRFGRNQMHFVGNKKKNFKKPSLMSITLNALWKFGIPFFRLYWGFTVYSLYANQNLSTQQYK